MLGQVGEVGALAVQKASVFVDMSVLAQVQLVLGVSVDVAGYPVEFDPEHVFRYHCHAALIAADHVAEDG